MIKLPVLIIGDGLVSRYVSDVLEAQDILVYGFLNVERGKSAEKEIYDIPVLGAYDEKKNLELIQNAEADFFIAVDNSAVRYNLLERLYRLTQRFPVTIVHPKAYVSSRASYAAGNMVNANSSIASEVQMEAVNYIGSNCVLEIGVRLGSANTLEAGVVIGAHTSIGSQTRIGAGAIIYPGLTIGNNAIIETGSVINQSMPDQSIK
jgi:UDP-3-O-[3-hydroxymyristoyl] glucosamine N-acyltransferase